MPLQTRISNVAATLPKLAQSAVGKEVFRNTAAQTLPKLAQSVSAKEVFRNTVAQMLPILVQSVAATHGGGVSPSSEDFIMRMRRRRRV